MAELAQPLLDYMLVQCSSSLMTISFLSCFKASEREKIIVGRIVVVVLVVFGLLWLPLIDRKSCIGGMA